MSNDIHLAFAHPTERSVATAPEGVLDRISLRDHIVSVEIGAFQAERGKMQRIAFNIVVEVRHAGDDLGDDVDRILSYDRVTEAIDAELAEQRINLLETLAENVAERILREPQSERVFVRIEKLDRGGGALGVEIVRAAHGEPAGLVTDAAAPAPRIIYLGESASGSLLLEQWLDGLEQANEPVILCVGGGIGSGPRATDRAAQKRIDLLSIEQSAWVLAGRDARCVVVETRTELDWALKNGQISLWAPSKLVLDAVNGPVGDTVDGPVLCLWLAGQIGAREIVFVGEPVPETCDIPCRHLSVRADVI